MSESFTASTTVRRDFQEYDNTEGAILIKAGSRLLQKPKKGRPVIDNVAVIEAVETQRFSVWYDTPKVVYACPRKASN